jgi:hypothetical protein
LTVPDPNKAIEDRKRLQKWNAMEGSNIYIAGENKEPVSQYFLYPVTTGILIE